MSELTARDIVYLQGVQCPCVIGVYEWEKQVTQTLVLDIELATDVRLAAADDDLTQAIDYKAVAERVQEFASKNKFALIETLIERLATVILTEFDTQWVRIKLDKGKAVKGVNNVGLVIERCAE